MAAVGQTEGRPADRTLFGHPVGLANLFGVELWERFSFYGMLTILGYYLYYSVTEGGLELPKSIATGIVGAYGGLVYLSTVLGGWIADRLLGMERTVLYGGVVVWRALRQGRRPLRRGFHPLLPRHQPRRLHRSVDHRPSAEPCRIPLRLRGRRDRHGAGPGAVCRVPPQPG